MGICCIFHCLLQVGTTVVIDSLFDTLPVRRKEFEKTAKKEFGRVLTAVQSFALSRPDVKFICGNTIAGLVWPIPLKSHLNVISISFKETAAVNLHSWTCKYSRCKSC